MDVVRRESTWPVPAFVRLRADRLCAAAGRRARRRAHPLGGQSRRHVRAQAGEGQDVLVLPVHGGVGKEAAALRRAGESARAGVDQDACLRWREAGVGAACARGRGAGEYAGPGPRSEEHTSELQSLMRISYAVFCLKKKKTRK